MGGTDRLIDPIHQQRRVGSRQYLRHQHPAAVLPHPILRAQHSPQPAYEPPALFGQLSLGDQRAHGLVDQAQHDLQIAGGGVGENEFQLLFHRRLAAGALMGNRSRDVVQSPNSWEQPRRQTRPLGQCAGVLGGWCRRYCHDNRWIPWLTTGDRQRVGVTDGRAFDERSVSQGHEVIGTMGRHARGHRTGAFRQQFGNRISQGADQPRLTARGGEPFD